MYTSATVIILFHSARDSDSEVSLINTSEMLFLHCGIARYREEKSTLHP